MAYEPLARRLSFEKDGLLQAKSNKIVSIVSNMVRENFYRKLKEKAGGLNGLYLKLGSSKEDALQFLSDNLPGDISERLGQDGLWVIWEYLWDKVNLELANRFEDYGEALTLLELSLTQGPYSEISKFFIVGYITVGYKSELATDINAFRNFIALWDKVYMYESIRGRFLRVSDINHAYEVLRKVLRSRAAINSCEFLTQKRMADLKTALKEVSEIGSKHDYLKMKIIDTDKPEFTLMHEDTLSVVELTIKNGVMQIVEGNFPRLFNIFQNDLNLMQDYIKHLQEKMEELSIEFKDIVKNAWVIDFRLYIDSGLKDMMVFTEIDKETKEKLLRFAEKYFLTPKEFYEMMLRIQAVNNMRTLSF